MKLKDGFVLRTVAGETVVIPTGDDMNLNMMITLNGTGRFLWEHLEKGAEKEDLLKAMLGDRFDVYSMREMGINMDVEENGETFEENAFIKASTVASLGYIGVADDSGLCVDCLQGAPGVYSARYGGEGLDDVGRYQLLLQNMRGVTDRAAHFTSAIACIFPNGDTIDNNNMTGQICLHFTNSKGHASGEVSDSHSEAIQYAYTFLNKTGRNNS